MSNKLKLFVWTDFQPDYTSGLAFAIAETEEQARELVEKSYECRVREWGTLNVFPANAPIAFCVSGGG